MSNKILTKRNIILYVVIAIILVAIPVTLRLAQTQQQLKSKAAGEGITINGSFTPQEVGTYIVAVNAYGYPQGSTYDATKTCSGNPLNNYDPANRGWVDCGPNDNVTVNVANLPDLITTNLNVLANTSAGLVVGLVANLEGTIKNQGTAMASAAAVSYKVDNQLIAEQSTPEIAPNYATTKSAAWTATTAGTHTFTICADSNNVVTESDEINNCSNLEFTVEATAPPPPPPPPANSINGTAYWFSSGGWWVPDSNITVTVYIGSTVVATGISGTDGIYSVTNVPAGTYTVTGETNITGQYLGGGYYSDVKNNITVTDGQATTNVNLYLLP
ncbi:hypothetical protein HYS94_02420 [Candidatus Daviesbacteria bacterium]|nr:hypothetical protein [Candidatus Daviesbacteria bacterium]